MLKQERVCRLFVPFLLLVGVATAVGCMGEGPESDVSPDAGTDATTPADDGAVVSTDASGPSDSSTDAGPDDGAVADSSPSDATADGDGGDGGADAGADAAVVSTTVELFAGFTATLPTGSSSPINTFYRSRKVQWLVYASDLVAAGVPANAVIDGIDLQAAEIPGREIEGFRLGLANTNAVADGVTAFPRPFYDNTNVVYGPTDQATTRWSLSSWTSFPFTTAFVWNGTSNVVVELSFTLAVDAVVNGGLAARTTGRPNAIVRYYSHGVTTYPFTGTNSINGGDAVPAMRVTYH